MDYSEDAPFNDPVVRCTECQKLLFREELQEIGRCSCGCRKVRNVESLSDGEMALMNKKGIDSEFAKLFERVSNA